MVNFAYIVSNLITLAISVAQIKATLIVPKLKLRASELTNLILSTLFIVYCYYKDRAIVFILFFANGSFYLSSCSRPSYSFSSMRLFSFS